jgi:hypothetical protein
MNNKPIIAFLVKRTVFFFFAICILTFLLYGIGTGQGFMDTTQFELLRLSIIFGLFLGVGSLYGIILNCVLFIRATGAARHGVRGSVRVSGARFAGGMGAYILMGLTGFVVAAAAAFILVAAEGNKP